MHNLRTLSLQGEVNDELLFWRYRHLLLQRLLLGQTPERISVGGAVPTPRIYCNNPRPHVHIHHGRCEYHTHRTTWIRHTTWTQRYSGWLLLGLAVLAAYTIPDLWYLVLRLGSLLVTGAVVYYGYTCIFGGSHGRRRSE
jgi:hypothetical protein